MTWKWHEIQISVSIKIYWNAPRPFVYILSVAALTLQWRCWAREAENTWSTKPKVFIFWAFTENFCQARSSLFESESTLHRCMSKFSAGIKKTQSTQNKKEGLWLPVPSDTKEISKMPPLRTSHQGSPYWEIFKYLSFWSLVFSLALSSNSQLSIQLYPPYCSAYLLKPLL